MNLLTAALKKQIHSSFIFQRKIHKTFPPPTTHHPPTTQKTQQHRAKMNESSDRDLEKADSFIFYFLAKNPEDISTTTTQKTQHWFVFFEK
jgi:hypothetical protein